MRRRTRQQIGSWKRKLMEDFARDLSRLYPDTLPLPGYYVRDEEGFTLLAGETDATQDRRVEESSDDTLFAFGVRVEGGIGDGAIEASPVIVVMPT